MISLIQCLMIIAAAGANGSSWSNVEYCYYHTPAIVVGKVVSVQDATPREIDRESVQGWLFPHAIARIQVVEVLKNFTGLRVAAGDTISLFYATDDTGEHPEKPGYTVDVNHIKKPDLHTGSFGAFGMGEAFGEWRSVCRDHYRGSQDLNLVREIAAELSPERWAERAPVIAIAEVVGLQGTHDREVESGGSQAWLARHVIQEVEIREVIKNESGHELNRGDRLHLVARIGRREHSIGDESSTRRAKYFRQPAEPGYSELLALRFDGNAWHVGWFCPHREMSMEAAIRKIVRGS